MRILLRNSSTAIVFLVTASTGISTAFSGNYSKTLPRHYWQGGYIGPTFSLHNLENSYNPAAPLGVQNVKAGGKAIGLIAGYNFHYSNFMYGLEADFVEGSAFRDDLSFLTSARVRIGKPINYSMPYITGGVALASLRKSAASSPFKVSKPQVGLVIGSGFEQALANAITGRVEYTYGRFFSNGYPGGPTIRLKNVHMVRASIAIHFND